MGERVTISDEAVEAAAKQRWSRDEANAAGPESDYRPIPWDEASPTDQREYRAGAREDLEAALPLLNAWRPISTRPDCDDLMWFARGDTIDGPRSPSIDDADCWDWWCLCESPPLPPPPAEEHGDG